MRALPDDFEPFDPEDGGSDNPPAPAARHRAPAVRLLNFREYRKRHPQTRRLLIDGLIRQGTVIGVSALAGYGKTALLVELSRVLTTGEPFLGRETIPSVVAYVASEDEDDVCSRLEAAGVEGVLIVQAEDGLRLTQPAKAKLILREVIKLARLRYPGRPVVIPIDTARAAIGGGSVLEDKITSPAFNALRELAEEEGVVIIVTNHANRENPRATKGETLEAVVSLELFLLKDGDSYQIWVGKNRSGPAHRQIGRVRYTSVRVGAVQASIVAEMVAEAGGAEVDAPKERAPGANQKLFRDVLQIELGRSGEKRRPFGADGPTVLAVKETAVLAEFLRRKPGDKVEDKRKGFTRAMTSEISRRGIVRLEDEHQVAWVWTLGKDDHRVPGHSPVDAPADDIT